MSYEDQVNKNSITLKKMPDMIPFYLKYFNTRLSMLECFIITHTPKPCDLYNWAMDIYWILYPIKRQQTFLSNSHEIFMKSYHVLENQESLNTPEAPKGGPTLSHSLPLCHWCCLAGLGPGTPGELCLERVGFNRRCGPAQPCAPQDCKDKCMKTALW